MKKVKPEETEEPSSEQIHQDAVEEFARRLAAAYISVYADISLGYAYKTYAQGEKVAQYWIDIAEKIFSDMTNGSWFHLQVKTDEKGKWLNLV